MTEGTCHRALQAVMAIQDGMWAVMPKANCYRHSALQAVESSRVLLPCLIILVMRSRGELRDAAMTMQVQRIACSNTDQQISRAPSVSCRPRIKAFAMVRAGKLTHQRKVSASCMGTTWLALMAGPSQLSPSVTTSALLAEFFFLLQ